MFYESRLLVDSDSRSLRFVHFNILKNSCLSSRFPVPSCPRPESGCKGKACFSFSKFFKLFFQTFFREPFQTLLATISFKPFLVLALSLESGCKDKAIKSFLPNFYPVIFYFFTTYCSTVNCKCSFSRLTCGKYQVTAGPLPGKNTIASLVPTNQRRPRTSLIRR